MEVEIHDIGSDSEATYSDDELDKVVFVENIGNVEEEHVLTLEDQWKLFEDAKREVDAKAQAKALAKKKEVDAKAQAEALAKQQELEAKAKVEELARQHKEKEDLLQQEKEVDLKLKEEKDKLDLLQKIHE